MLAIFFLIGVAIILITIAYGSLWLSENFVEWFNYSYRDEKDKT